MTWASPSSNDIAVQDMKWASPSSNVQAVRLWACACVFFPVYCTAILQDNDFDGKKLPQNYLDGVDLLEISMFL